MSLLSSVAFKRRILFLPLLALPLLSVSTSAQAQVFEPGLIVNSVGDTLRGEVENNYWKEAPGFIRFRSSAAAPAAVYPTRRLRAISFPAGRYFRREVLALVPAPTQVTALARPGISTEVKPDTVLAEVLVDGPATLLRVVKDGTTHYLARRDGKPDLAMAARKKLAQNSQGRMVSVDGNDYRNQLTLYFLDCPAATALVAKAPFTAEGLVGVVQAYNQSCSANRQAGRNWLTQSQAERPRSQPAPPAPTYQSGALQGQPVVTPTPPLLSTTSNGNAEKPGSLLQGGIIGGARFNMISSSEECIDCGLHPWGGFYADLLLPGRSKAIYGEISLTSFNMEGAGPTPSGTGRARNTYRGTLATARIGLRFLRPLAHNNQFIIGLGYELNKVVSSTLLSNGQAVTLAYEDDFPSTTLIPNLMVGWRHARVTVSLDGQMYSNAGESESLFVGGSGALRLGLAYRLGGNANSAR